MFFTTFFIFIKPLNGITIQLEVKPSTTIGALKDLIKNKTGKSCYLIDCGNLLNDDEKTLCELGLVKSGGVNNAVTVLQLKYKKLPGKMNNPDNKCNNKSARQKCDANRPKR